MVDKFKPQEFDINLINGGIRYQNGDGVNADSINAAIEASAYAQALATNPPDTTNANNVGTPTVSIQKTFDGTPQLKFENLKGGSGAKLVSQTLQGQDANGGNIYLQTFDDGTTATFVAPRGERGVDGGVTGVKGNAESSYRTGNVNITPANVGAVASSDLATKLYPVGSIYISTNSTSPASANRLGFGSWVRIKDRFLLAAGDSYTAGTSGGSADAVVVSHRHFLFGSDIGSSTGEYLNGAGTVTSYSSSEGTQAYTIKYSPKKTEEAYNGTSGTTGESGTGKNMPPYLVVYMWKRTA